MIKIIKGVVTIDCEFLENGICKKSGEWCDEECPDFIVTKHELGEYQKERRRLNG